MKDYSKMSDFEINKAVTTALGMDVSGATEENNIMYGYVPDICNNPSDAWPVILESRISLRPDDMYEEAPHSGYWRADNEAGNHCHHENPLRAAMIVYLMMKDAEK